MRWQCFRFSCVCGCVSHPEPAGVENFGVLGEVHVQAAVVVERHGHLLQRLVPAVRTEHLVHVAGGPEGRSTASRQGANC